MSINRKELEEIATLAQLNIPDSEADEIVSALNQVVHMIEHINNADTDAIIPMSNPNDATQVVRLDEVKDISHKNELLNLSSSADEDHYLVPKVID